MIHVAGSPIDGKSPPHDKRWRATIVTAAAGIDPATAVRLDFRLEPHRTVDLDSLTTPALAGLRDAGVSLAATDGLDAILATTTPTYTDPGVDVEPTIADAVARIQRPSGAEVVVAHLSKPRSETVPSKHDWRDTVRRQQRTINLWSGMDRHLGRPHVVA